MRQISSVESPLRTSLNLEFQSWYSTLGCQLTSKTKLLSLNKVLGGQLTKSHSQPELSQSCAC